MVEVTRELRISEDSFSASSYDGENFEIKFGSAENYAWYVDLKDIKTMMKVFKALIKEVE